jgi:hypothetical protein
MLSMASTGGTSLAHPALILARTLVIPVPPLTQVVTFAAPYGPLSEETRALYGWDLIIESSRESTLKVENPLEGAVYK